MGAFLFTFTSTIFTFVSTIFTCLLCCVEEEDEKYAQMKDELNRDIKYYYGYK